MNKITKTKKYQQVLVLILRLFFLSFFLSVLKCPMQGEGGGGSQTSENVRSLSGVHFKSFAPKSCIAKTKEILFLGRYN